MDPIIYTGRATYKLVTKMGDVLGTHRRDELDIRRFSDQEPWYSIGESYKDVPGRDVFVVQSTSVFAPTNYFDLWAILWAVKDYNPRKLVAVMPFMGFRRQERRVESGEAVMLSLMAKFVETAGATDVVLVEPHCEEKIRKYFSIPVHVIDANPLFAEALASGGLFNCAVVTPDAGREGTASRFAGMLDLPLVVCGKGRPAHNVAQSNGLVAGDVRGKRIIMRDDELDTLGTAETTVNELERAGAVEVWLIASHAVLSGPATQRLKKSKLITRVIVTDTIYLPWEKRLNKIEVVSVAPLLAEKIREINSQ